jgi:hypothetical protein
MYIEEDIVHVAGRHLQVPSFLTTASDAEEPKPREWT